MTDHSQTEDIADWVAFGLQVLDIDNLRSNIPRRSTPHKQILRLIGPGRQPKVRNHTIKVILLPQEYILWFEIPMHYSFSVHVLQPHKQSSQNESDLLGSEFLLSLELVV